MNTLHKYIPKKGRTLILMALALQAACHLNAMLPDNNRDNNSNPENSSQEAQAGADRRRARPDDVADDNNRPLRRARLEQEAIMCNCRPTHTFSEQDAPGLYMKFPCCADCRYAGIIDYFGQRAAVNPELARPVQAREIDIIREDPVILESFTPGSAVSTIACGHTFLTETVDSLRGRNCPLCRAVNRNVIQRTLPLMPLQADRLVERLEQPQPVRQAEPLAGYNPVTREYRMMYDGVRFRPVPPLANQIQNQAQARNPEQQQEIPFFQQQQRENRAVQAPRMRVLGRTYSLTTIPVLQPGQNNARVQVTNRIQLTVLRARAERTTAPDADQQPPAPEQP